MLPTIGVLFLLILTALPAKLAAGPAGFDVTNEQLRGAMLTLVSSYNTLENNLERHEIRERALGEVIKKGLQTLHKGQRIFEPMRGTFSRLDERISQMETLLMARESEQRAQQVVAQAASKQQLDWQRERDVAATAERQQRDVQHAQLLEAIKAIATTQKEAAAAAPTPKSKPSDDDDSDEDDVGKKVDDLADSVKLLRQELAELMADRAHADDTLKQLVAQTERAVSTSKTTSEEAVDKLSEKLTSFYVTASTTPAPAPVAASNAEWERKITDQLTTVSKEVSSVLAAVGQLPSQPDRAFFAALTNDTLEAITDMRIEVLTASDKSFAKTATRIKEATLLIDESISEALRSLGETAVPVPVQQPHQTTVAPGGLSSAAAAVAAQQQAAAVEQLNEAVLHSYAELKADLVGLRQLEKLALETGDNVLAVKRAMEYNVHAVTSEVGEIIRTEAAAQHGALAVHFGQLNGTIEALNTGALANLTSKIETEISQVWRQIGIMFQMVQSTEMSLNKLQEQTEIYVNGTSAVMDGMGGKVGQITERMAEVDSNLNYLLGRLSLVTQEFNQIKTGLGSALDDIKSSFQSVQKKIQDVGPGPHNIAENETDYNVVNDQPMSNAEAAAAAAATA